ncbi:hypothetical protein [Streptomyces sp. NPDC001435]|uniref:hypothetical protein n=1 Tax=unclassified Streptomyces TaxID=2593676 RepID=UPI00369C36E2
MNSSIVSLSAVVVQVGLCLERRAPCRIAAINAEECGSYRDASACAPTAAFEAASRSASPAARVKIISAHMLTSGPAADPVMP